MRGIWKRMIENNEFSAVFSFFLSLGIVQIAVLLDVMSFDFVLPWITLVFIWYGFGERVGAVGIARRWWKDGAWQRKGIAAAMLVVVANGLLLEGVIRPEQFGKWVLTGIFFVFLYLYIWLILERGWNFWSFVGAVLFGLLSATGNPGIFDRYGWGGYISALLCWGCLFYLCLECCYCICQKIVFVGKARDLASARRGKYAPLKWGAAAFAASALIDMVFLLAFFPGVMEYDSYVQMCQVYGEPYSNHHPWLHTMVIKLIYQFGQSVLGSNNRAFALYSLFSICMLSFAFACVIAFLRYKGVKGCYLVIFGAIYLLSPINQMYSITMWKDIPFAVSVILFMLLLCLLKDDETGRGSKRACWILMVPVGFCVCFFRSNGLYVFWGMIPFLIWAFWKQKKAVIAVIGAVLLLGAVYKGPVFDYFEVEEPDTIESLSIPAQQIAAMIANEGVITEAQKALLSQVIDLEQVPEAYLNSTGCSDAIKELVRETDNQQYIVEHAGEFLKTWVQLFGANKRIYVKAFIAETEGYWYHKISFPFIWATYIQENGMGIYRASQLPDGAVEAIRGYLKAYKAHFDKYLSTGLYVYIYFISLFLALREKNRYLIAYLPALGIWGTLLIATPVWADLRYAYAIYLAAPFLVCLSMLEVYRGEPDE